MALRGCLLLSKQCAFFFNFIIWLSGIFLLCISIYIRMDSTFNHMVVVAYPNLTVHFHFVCYFLISLATIITLVGFFGCCSSFQESHSMLSMFIGCLVLFLMAQMATACWIFMHRSSLKHSAGENIRKYIDHTYGANPFSNEPLDHLQITFKCCGSEGPTDFLDSPINNRTNRNNNKNHNNRNNNHNNNKNIQNKHKENAKNQKQQSYYNLPTSCCGYYDIRSKQTINCIKYHKNSNNNNNNNYNNNNNLVNNNNNNNNVKSKSVQTFLTAYDKGCRDELVSSMRWLVEGVVVVALVFVAVQLLSLTLSICLCCGLKRHSAGGYK